MNSFKVEKMLDLIIPSLLLISPVRQKLVWYMTVKEPCYSTKILMTPKTSYVTIYFLRDLPVMADDL